MIPKDWRRHPYARVFVLTLLITAIARGAAFLPAYSIDDYWMTQRDNLDTNLALRQGRFGQAVLLQILQELQLEPQYARVFFFLFALLVSALLATAMVRHWSLRPSGWLPVAAAAMIAIHPFATELFTFRTALGICMAAFAMLALLLAPRRWSPGKVLAGSALFALALSTYQVVLHYGMMLVLMTVVIALARQVAAAAPEPGGEPRNARWSWSWSDLVRNRNCALFACLALGTVGYVLVGWLVAKLLRFPLDARATLLAPAEISGRLAAVAQVLRSRLVEPDGFLNSSGKALLGLLLLVALVALSARMVRRRRWRVAAQWLAVVGLLGLALLWTVGVLLVLAEFWPVARLMAHSGVFWAGVLVIAHSSLRPRLRPALGVLALLIVLSFIGAGNRVLNDQLRLNARDAAKVSRIANRLEDLPGFTGKEPLVVLGRDWQYAMGYHTADLDMNSSAFGADWAKLSLFREITGYRFQSTASDGPEAAAAAAYCRRVAPWPGPAAVTIENGVAIVCLESD